jgi:outer membrane protein assembly factor BamB
VDYGTDDGDLMKAYSTPIVVQVDGRRQLISPAAMATMSYDPQTGEELWRIRYEQHSSATRPLFGHDLFFINTGFPKAQLFAVRAGGVGNITDTHVAWVATRSVPSMSSQLLVGDLLFMINDGVATCLDARSGEEVWQQRIAGKYVASPIYADGRIYVFDQEGKTTVLKAGRQYEELAVNQLADGFMASPAVKDRSLILRTRTHLYRIE